MEALRDEADLWVELDREANRAIPGKVLKAATADVGLNLQDEGIVEVKKSKRKRGRALPLVRASEEVKRPWLGSP